MEFLKKILLLPGNVYLQKLHYSYEGLLMSIDKTLYLRRHFELNIAFENTFEVLILSQQGKQ